MKKIFQFTILALLLASCGGSKKISKTSSKRTTTIRDNTSSPNKKLNNIIDYATTFEGTRYKFGGTTKSGMDCSGLVFTAFAKENVQLPRVSRDMATRGKKVSLSKVKEGDLVFFQTNKNRRVINHVGLVTSAKGGAIRFIHSTTSRGVIVSSLEERYWKSAFVEVRRII